MSIAVGLIALSAAIAVRGIQLAAWVQYALIALQVVAIGGFCWGAFAAMAAGTAPSTGEPVSLSWFNPFAVGDRGRPASPASSCACSSTGAGMHSSR